MTGDRCKRLLIKAKEVFEAWTMCGGYKSIELIWEKWSVVDKRLSKPEVRPESFSELQQCINDWVGLVKAVWKNQ